MLGAVLLLGSLGLGVVFVVVRGAVRRARASTTVAEKGMSADRRPP